MRLKTRHSNFSQEAAISRLLLKPPKIGLVLSAAMQRIVRLRYLAATHFPGISMEMFTQVVLPAIARIHL